MAVSRVGVVVIVCLAMTVLSGARASASEAQAALMGGGAGHRYVIPAKLSVEEQRWYKVFQDGNLISEGWQDISAEILAKTLPEQRAAQKVALENLGAKIGTEWCRANGVRKVDSSMLLEWGDILRKTARTNPQRLAKAIDYIDQEVDAVLD